MGNALTSLGFNQPFFFTLIGIMLLLIGTVALVSDPQEEEMELPSRFDQAYMNISLGNPRQSRKKPTIKMY
ncbi:unnamed protein product [Bursaphelenchus okinawaensis]|uniref:Uncharacterized protein n=1 Tax=Bursaphelenchus okinawaensis TaxID=465554 RepID=A0A811LPN2_9BILA|nr:unnamed protein product [Bursaphelenchus okinawaensis]CAG9127666.1 unnamed protein product [Bursaphelenchus okinawaensis]